MNRLCALASLALLSVLLSALLPAAVVAQPLDLNAAVAAALANQPQLAAYAAQARGARELAVAEGQLPDPKLRFGIQNLPVTGSDAWSTTVDSMTMKTVGFMQDFTREEKRQARAERAERESERSDAEARLAQANIRREAALAWLDAFHAEQARAIVARMRGETESQLAAAELALRAGQGTAADVIAARVELAGIADRSYEFDAAAAKTRAMLARWIGAAARRELAHELPASPRPDLTAIEAGLAEHPAIAVADRAIGVALAEERTARAATQPDWSMEVMYGQRSSGRSDMLTLQFSVDLPLAARDRQDRRTAERIAQADALRANRADRLRVLTAEFDAARAAWEAANARLDVIERELLPRASQRIELALAAYRANRAGIAPVIEARRARLEAELKQHELAVERVRARALLAYFEQG